MPRRVFLRGAATAIAGATGATVAGRASRANAATTATQTATASTKSVASRGDSPDDRFTFHGDHQAGILTPARASAAFVSFDVTTTSRDELVDLMRTLTS